MSQRILQERVRSAFAALTRPPRPQLGDRIRDSLWGRPAAPVAGRPRPARRLLFPPAALVAVVVVLALATGAVLAGPSLAGRLGAVGRQLARTSFGPRPLAGGPPVHTPSPRPSPTPTSSASPSAAPSPEATPSAAPTPVPAATPPPPGPPLAAPLPGYSCASQSGAGAGPAAMTTARVGAQNSYDRFVIQFSGGVAAYQVRPQGGATFAQSGGAASVALRGSSGLAVVLQNASGSGTYTGPTDFLPGFTEIQEAKLLSDSQGVVEWGIGLAHTSCFHAWTLGSPSRLVIDVQD